LSEIRISTNEKTPKTLGFRGSVVCGVGDTGLEPNACSLRETASSESGGTPGGTMVADRLSKLTELLANVASLSNEDLTKLLNTARHVERQ
jgi:hypothetical protein